MISIDQYLQPQSTFFIVTELDQLMAVADDKTQSWEKRDRAYCVAYFLAKELERRKSEGIL